MDCAKGSTSRIGSRSSQRKPKTMKVSDDVPAVYFTLADASGKYVTDFLGAFLQVCELGVWCVSRRSGD